MNLDELKTVKINEYEEEYEGELIDTVVSFFSEQSDENKATAEKITENEWSYIYDEAFEEILAHKVFGRQKIPSFLKKVERRIRKKYRELNYQKTVDEMEEVEGYFLGGEDWQPSKDSGKTKVDKQKIVLLTSAGFFENLSTFGHTPTKGVDLIIGQKYRFKYSTFHGTNSDFHTAKSATLLEDGNDEELAGWLEREFINLQDVNETDDKWQTRVFLAKVSWISGNPRWVESGRTRPVLDKRGKRQYDKDGNELVEPVMEIDGSEDIIQSRLDGSEEDIFVGRLSLANDENQDSDDYKRYFSVKFFNQDLGQQLVDLDVLNNDDTYADLLELEAEEAEEFLNDELQGSEIPEVVVVATPKKFRNYTKNEGETDECEVDTVDFSSTFVSQPLARMIGDKKKA